MAIVHDFAYVRPESLHDAVSALAEPGASVLAGGTDMVAWLREGDVAPRLLVDIKQLPGLHEITVDGDRLEIGALVTFSDLIASTTVRAASPMLAEMAHHVASPGIRNRATVAGNLCSAVPSLDAGPALLVYDATVRVLGPDGPSLVPLADWFTGPRQTRLDAGRLVTGVTLRLPPERHGAAFGKLSRYRGEDLAQVNLAVLVTAGDEYRLAFGAVAPVPFRARAIEALLDGRPLSDEAIATARAAVPAAIAPISDIRSSAEYRAHICGVMLDRALRIAAARRDGIGPDYPAHVI